ncbi:MAG: hypothetical protein ACK6D3_23565 [Planctomycetaceae bacterium]
MESRQKLLLGVLGGAVAAWQGYGLLNNWVLGPVTNRQEEITQIERKIQEKEQSKLRQRKAARQLKELGERSLPPDPVIAANAFQKFLDEMGAKAQLANLVVERPRADNQKKENTYFAVHGILKGQGTLGQVTTLLHEIQKSGLLTRITNLKLQSQGKQGDPKLNVELNIDALALVSSPARKELWTTETAPGPLASVTVPDAKSLESIGAKNLFVRAYNGPPKPPDPPAPPPPPPPPPPSTPPEPSTAEYVYFVGSVTRNGVPDAFLFDRSSNRQTVLKPGKEFDAGGMKGRVLKIADKTVTLLVGEDEFQLELGKNLTQMRKLAKAPAVEETKTPEGT